MCNRHIGFVVTVVSLFAAHTGLCLPSNPPGRMPQCETGLSFRSHESNKDLRTSLEVSSEGEFELGDYLSLEFDARIRPKSENYGYIYKIEAAGRSIDLLLNNHPYSSLNLQLHYNRFLAQQSTHGRDGVDYFRWNRYRLEFIVSDSAFIILHNGEEVVRDTPPARGQKHGVRIVFGADYTPGRVSCDVAPVDVRMVSVATSRRKPAYVWPLDVHYTDLNVYDTLRRRQAKVLNPDWIIDRHIKWKHIRTMDFPSTVFPVVAGSKLMLVSASEVSCYDMKDDSVIWRKRFTPELPVAKMKNQFVWDAARERLVLYDMENDVQPVIRFDPVRGQWSGQYSRNGNYTYLHHNKLYSPRDSSLLQLFGYGMHRYRGDAYRLAPDGQVKHYDLSAVIPSRYMSAVGVTDSLLYIYGGVGNLSGKQEFGAEIFNDLYVMDLRDYKATLLWDRATTSDSEVAAGTLLPGADGKTLTGLFFCPSRYASYLVLKEFDIINGDFRLLADTIPYSFHDTGSVAGLTADTTQGKLYAYTMYKTGQEGSRLDVYSIETPALSVSQAIFAPPAKWREMWWNVVVAAMCLFALTTVLLLVRRRRESPVQVEIDEEAIRTANEQARTLRARPGIYLLGDFGVIDAAGKDIASEFTPTMRQILNLIIFNTEHNGRGVSNAQLRETLWWDKSEESVRNNRNVNMRKIRLLLETVGGLQITTDANYWKIAYSDDGYCDWVYAVRYMDKIAASPRIALRRLPELLQLVSMGRLLSGEAFDWLDDQKSRYSDKVIGLLGALRDGDLFIKAPQAQVLICEGILSFDSLDEDSMKVRCRAMVALGRIGAAKNSFDTFVREYSRVMGESYPHSFEKLFQT